MHWNIFDGIFYIIYSLISEVTFGAIGTKDFYYQRYYTIKFYLYTYTLQENMTNDLQVINYGEFFMIGLIFFSQFQVTLLCVFRYQLYDKISLFSYFCKFKCEH